uniref:Uncharacterized protein n=1 Tax=Plectus sambesii TaxID=2011161 RepID=A0A914WLG4_9BILA
MRLRSSSPHPNTWSADPPAAETDWRLGDEKEVWKFTPPNESCNMSSSSNEKTASVAQTAKSQLIVIFAAVILLPLPLLYPEKEYVCA